MYAGINNVRIINILILVAREHKNIERPVNKIKIDN
jgi:hypothetical protein